MTGMKMNISSTLPKFEGFTDTVNQKNRLFGDIYMNYAVVFLKRIGNTGFQRRNQSGSHRLAKEGNI